MKVRNIMFFGFAAAILMGTANAAGTFQIASKAYVDSRVSSASSAASEVADAVGDMDDLGDTENSNITSGTDNLVDAVNDLDAALNTKQNVSDSSVTNAGNHLTAGNGVGANLEALDTALVTAEGAISTLNEQINGDPEDSTDNGLAGDIEDLQDAIGTLPANSNIADLLDGKVDKADAATTIRGVSSASDDKWATELAVATIVDGLTGGGGTVSQQIADALGSDFTGQDAYADVTAALADKQDKSDSNVTTAGTYIQTGTGVAANLGRLDTALGTVAGTVGDSNSGLVKDVADLQDVIGDSTDGLAKDVADLKDTVGDSTDGLVADVEALQTLTNVLASYTTCVTNNANESGHCALTADENGMSWTFVTDPWIEGEESAGGEG